MDVLSPPTGCPASGAALVPEELLGLASQPSDKTAANDAVRTADLKIMFDSLVNERL